MAIFGRLFGGKPSRGPVRRKHSVFGDFIVGDTSVLSEQERGVLDSDVVEHNKLWQKYLDDCGWGSIPTQKGFRRWLAARLKEQS